MSMKFYKCMHCGNVITKMVDSGVPVVCCGEKMVELVPNTSDGAKEKHVPVVTVKGSIVTVNVSTVEHTSLENHYIQWIAIETENGYEVKNLKPGDKPQAQFVLGEGDKVVAAYEYCSLHGLWKTQL